MKPTARGGLACALALAVSSCEKVPIYDVAAGFTLADAAWFAEEETLFVFYKAQADQGIGEPSVIEITYATDDERVDWTVLEEIPTVHPHVHVDCGSDQLCGSASLRVPVEPREVDIRLRYHRDGELALEADTVFNVVGEGPPHHSRSLIVYGVFDETNQLVQWRGRHQFPTVRNGMATVLGLRREFTITEQRYGPDDVVDDDPSDFSNAYLYGEPCPSSYIDAEMETVQTYDRAAFNHADLPLEASDDPAVCAQSTVRDATGEFTTTAVARKNPQVRPAFPVLRSPIHDATVIPFFLAPCDRTISPEHEAMQRQRLQMEDEPTYCIDDWRSAGFSDALAVALQDAVEAERPAGNDMVLAIGLHQDEDGIAEKVEAALEQVVPEERHRATPRLSGAFVFDSSAYDIAASSLDPATLWCPAMIPTGLDTALPGASVYSCPILLDNPDFVLGPLSFGFLPILPSRSQYLDFIDTYSDAQAGRVETLTFRTPEFATTTDHTDLGEFGVVTFLNEETISAEPEDAFSYCVGDQTLFFMFRSAFLQNEQFQQLIEKKCEWLGFPDEFCSTASLGLLPIEWLGDWHSLFQEDTYELGIFWDFPFLLRMEYEVVAAGAVSAFGLSVPFGIADSTESYFGSQMWTSEEFSLEETLTQCRRFCDHPTFDSAGVYHVTDPFRTTYASTCYQPVFPELGDSGYPLDP